jgi:hypothetical protein
LHFAFCNLVRGCLLTSFVLAGIAAPRASAQDTARGEARQAHPSSPGPHPSIYANTEGKARVTLFGLTGEGYKFVYVLDRSASMGGSGRTALPILKAELLESLNGLEGVHQFQIVYYNERPQVFNPSGLSGRLAFATEENKSRAARFIGSIVADGNTRHDDALKTALRLRPDVIFFLTDGDEPKLSRTELDQIQRMAGGITIHAIQFGAGPQPAAKGFMAVLAEENGGKYAFVNILDYRSGAKAVGKPGR